ncbi:hypothetical protein Tcan_08937 [Toxocara canis]|uniref:Uncharacterized protein n=1 Tax=Toxocara canis TaxID=6265 RepID=A0A0B2W0J3_TOXCA|nr:hypothetical protein Tcan_08937 [Toxocara canis]
MINSFFIRSKMLGYWLITWIVVTMYTLKVESCASLTIHGEIFNVHENKKCNGYSAQNIFDLATEDNFKTACEAACEKWRCVAVNGFKTPGGFGCNILLSITKIIDDNDYYCYYRD